MITTTRRKTTGMRRKAPVAAATALLSAALLTACTGNGTAGTAPSSPTASASPSTGATTSPSESSSAQNVEGTVVRFTVGSASVDVTIGEDTPATRDFVSMLPMTLELEEFNGREKIADLPRELAYESSPGSDPEDGDLIYFVPWGNIGFYYNTSGTGYSDQTIHLGTYQASESELANFEGQQTQVEVVD